MNPISDRIEKLIRHAEKLNAKAMEQKALVEKLQLESKNLKLTIDNQQQTIADLNNKIKITKLAQQISGQESSDKTELKRKINEYIREIDGCIALLND